jgi:hypothetical protein
MTPKSCEGNILGARFGAADCLATFGLVEAAVVCFGAGGGLLSPGTKSNKGRSKWRTLCCSAIARPTSRGTQVPATAISGLGP